MPERGRTYLCGVLRYYDITITVDGRPRSGKWTLRQGGKVHVTCIWGVHTLDCAPSQDPRLIASRALEQIIRAFHRERAALLERDGREVAAVNTYWDEQEKAKPEAATRARPKQRRPRGSS